MFVKGQSGNPSGRAAFPPELMARIRGEASGVVQFWIDTYSDPSIKWDYRNKAGENLVAYGFGKAKEIIDMDIAGQIQGITVRIIDPQYE